MQYGGSERALRCDTTRTRRQAFLLGEESEATSANPPLELLGAGRRLSISAQQIMLRAR